MKNIFKFHFVLGITTFFIAMCAAFFSVYGISNLFAGAATSVIVMASSLEIGKLVATTFLYRYWNKCKTYLKIYLIAAILILMAITSLGVFGYLSAAYQKSAIEFNVSQEKIKNTEEQKTFYFNKIDSSKKRISELTTLRASQENRMSDVLTNEYVSRNPLQLKQLQEQNIQLINSTDDNIKSENVKIQESEDTIQKINELVNGLKLNNADKKDVQTFKFVADALGVPLDTVARWFIICIIFVFDPLAVCLVLAYNVSVFKKEDDRIFDNNTPKIEKPEVATSPITSSLQSNTTDNQILPTTSSIENNQPSDVTQPTVDVKVQATKNIEKAPLDIFYQQYFK